MVYITGDTHGNFKHIEDFCKQHSTTKDDVLIILGDAGLNYFGDMRDTCLKKYVSTLPITLFCIRGNHEMRPDTIKGIKYVERFDDIAMIESEYPNIIYACDGVSYTFNNKKYFVVGGAYSVDKYYRLANDMHWFEDEQLSEEEMQIIKNRLEMYPKDYIHGFLTHTCPDRYKPVEWFLSSINQNTVDSSMEKFLDKIYETINHNIWYCGHFHGIKTIDKMVFMYKNIKELK